MIETRAIPEPNTMPPDMTAFSPMHTMNQGRDIAILLLSLALALFFVSEFDFIRLVLLDFFTEETRQTEWIATEVEFDEKYLSEMPDVDLDVFGFTVAFVKNSSSIAPPILNLALDGSWVGINTPEEE